MHIKIDHALFIEALEKEREELLNANPELRAYQAEIDKSLEGISDPLERATVLNQMLIKKMSEELFHAMAALRQVDSEVRAIENQLRSGVSEKEIEEEAS